MSGSPTSSKDQGTSVPADEEVMAIGKSDSSLIREYYKELVCVLTNSKPARESLAIGLFGKKVLSNLEKQEIMNGSGSATSTADELVGYIINRIDSQEHCDNIWGELHSVEALTDILKKIKSKAAVPLIQPPGRHLSLTTNNSVDPSTLTINSKPELMIHGSSTAVSTSEAATPKSGPDITSPCRDTQPIIDTTPNSQQNVKCPEYIVEEASSLNGIYRGLIFDIFKILKDMVNNGEIELANLAEIIIESLAIENDQYTFTGTETIDDVCSPITRNKNCFNPNLALLLLIDGAFCKSQFRNNIRSYRTQLENFLDSTTVTAFKETVMSQYEIWSTPNNSTDTSVAIAVRSFYGEMAISQIDDLKKFIFREYSSMIGLTMIHQSVLTITYSMPVEYFLPVLSTVIKKIDLLSLVGVLSITIGDVLLPIGKELTEDDLRICDLKEKQKRNWDIKKSIQNSKILQNMDLQQQALSFLQDKLESDSDLKLTHEKESKETVTSLEETLEERVKEIIRIREEIKALQQDFPLPCQEIQQTSETTPNNQHTNEIVHYECPDPIVEEAIALKGTYHSLVFKILEVLTDMVNNGEIKLANLAETINHSYEIEQYTFTGTETIDDVCSPITRNQNCFDPNLGLLLEIDGAFCKRRFTKDIRSYRSQLREFSKSTTIETFKEKVLEYENWNTPNNSTEIVVAIEVSHCYGKGAIRQINYLKKFIFGENSSIMVLRDIHHSVLTIVYSMPVEYFLPVLSTIIEKIDLLNIVGVLSITIGDVSLPIGEELTEDDLKEKQKRNWSIKKSIQNSKILQNMDLQQQALSFLQDKLESDSDLKLTHEKESKETVTSLEETLEEREEALSLLGLQDKLESESDSHLTDENESQEMTRLKKVLEERDKEIMRLQQETTLKHQLLTIDEQKELGSRLYTAADEGDVSLVKHLIQLGANVNYKKRSGYYTPLHEASMNDYTEIVQILLSNGASIEAKNFYGNTLLHNASIEGHTEVVQILLSNGASIEAKDRYGNTPLHNASNRGHTEVVQILLSNGASIEAKNDSGYTPLLIASNCGHTEVVQILLSNGASIEAKDRYGNTPLHDASNRGHTEVVQILLSNGASIEAKDRYGKTPLHDASNRGHTEVVQILLSNGASIEAKDRYGNTPLHNASIEGHTEVVQILLSNGASIEAKDRSGYTPLHKASNHGHTEVVQILLSNGASIEAKNNFLQSPLLVAIGSNHTSIAMLLISEKANIYAEDMYGQSPALMATVMRNVAVVKCLMSNGVKKQTIDKYRLSSDWEAEYTQYDSNGQITYKNETTRKEQYNHPNYNDLDL